MRCLKCRKLPAALDDAVCRRCDMEAKVAEVALVPVVDLPWRPDWKDRKGS